MSCWLCLELTEHTVCMCSPAESWEGCVHHAGAEVLQSPLSAVIYHGLLKGFKSDRADMINAQTFLFIHTYHSHFPSNYFLYLFFNDTYSFHFF